MVQCLVEHCFRRDEAGVDVDLPLDTVLVPTLFDIKIFRPMLEIAYLCET